MEENKKKEREEEKWETERKEEIKEENGEEERREGWREERVGTDAYARCIEISNCGSSLKGTLSLFSLFRQDNIFPHEQMIMIMIMNPDYNY